MVVKPEQERVRNLLTDTVTLLCKNGLTYNKEMKVQGLLGITLDEEEVFVVHIDERFCDLLAGRAMEELSQRPETPVEKEQESKSHKKRKRRRSSKDSDGESPSDSSQPAKRNLDSTSQDSFDNIRVKQEKTDVVCIDDDSGGNVNIKPDPASFQNYGLSQQTPMTSQGFAGRTLGAQMSDNSNTSWDGSQLPQLQTYQGGGSSANPAASSWNPGNNLPSTDNTDAPLEKTIGTLYQQLTSCYEAGEVATATEDDLAKLSRPPPISSSSSSSSTQRSQPKQIRTILPDDQKIKCDFPGCTSTFQYRKTMYRHQRKLHAGWQSPIKPLSGRSLPSKCSLEEALVQTEAEAKEASVPAEKKGPTFDCQFPGCGKSFVQKYSLSRHYKEKGHYPVGHVEMDTDSMKGKFENDDSINDNGESIADMALDGGDMLDGFKIYQCEFPGCSVSYTEEKMLIDHHKETHSEWYRKKHNLNASSGAEEDGVMLNETPDDKKLMAMLLGDDGKEANEKEVDRNVVDGDEELCVESNGELGETVDLGNL